jgi:lipid II:glycine glycyltransferase (peptidoglycan interpeptide bridge formation enzyme)
MQAIVDQQVASQTTQNKEELSILQERLQTLAQKEALYQELKKQFDEKNRYYIKRAWNYFALIRLCKRCD